MAQVKETVNERDVISLTGRWLSQVKSFLTASRNQVSEVKLSPKAEALIKSSTKQYEVSLLQDALTEMRKDESEYLEIKHVQRAKLKAPNQKPDKHRWFITIGGVLVGAVVSALIDAKINEISMTVEKSMLLCIILFVGVLCISLGFRK